MEGSEEKIKRYFSYFMSDAEIISPLSLRKWFFEEEDNKAEKPMYGKKNPEMGDVPIPGEGDEIDKSTEQQKKQGPPAKESFLDKYNFDMAWLDEQEDEKPKNGNGNGNEAYHQSFQQRGYAS